jgi:hypothetical protein
MDVFSGPITKGQMSLSIASNEGRLSFHRGSIGSQNSSLNMPWSVESYANVAVSLKRQTPTMAHGLATEVWSVRKMIEEVTA